MSNRRYARWARATRCARHSAGRDSSELSSGYRGLTALAGRSIGAPGGRAGAGRGLLVRMSPSARRHNAFVGNLTQLLVLRLAGRAIV